jgi:hypothetical protein
MRIVKWQGLYPTMSVQLVDGGVYDNYGLHSLYHDRSVIICFLPLC